MKNQKSEETAGMAPLSATSCSAPDTPRTDSQPWINCYPEYHKAATRYIDADFARELERELNQCREVLGEIRDCYEEGDTEGIRKRYIRFFKQNVEVTHEMGASPSR